MLFARSRVEQITEKLGDESFREPQYRAIYQALIAAGPESPIDEVTEHLDDDVVGTVEDLLAEGSYQMDPERTISDSWRLCERGISIYARRVGPQYSAR